MTSTERAHHRRKRRLVVVAAAVIAASSCAHPTKPPVTAGSLSDRDVVRLRNLDPQPRDERPRAKPVVRSPHPRAKHHPRPALIGTALTIRHLRVTEYCFEGSPTSLGKQPWIGVAAVKKASGIPYGAHLVIAGRRYVVGDREPSFGVSDVDLYAGRGPSCEREASRFGIQHLDVQIEAAA